MSNATGKILSTSELDEISNNLNVIKEAIENYNKKTQQVINSFNDQTIVQSFYSSGKFGTQERERLEKISNALQKYWEVVANGDESMIVQTQKYISRAMENNEGLVSATSFVAGPIESSMQLKQYPGTPYQNISSEKLEQVSETMEVYPGTPNQNSLSSNQATETMGVFTENSNQNSFAEQFNNINENMKVYPGTPVASNPSDKISLMELYPGTPNKDVNIADFINNQTGVNVKNQGIGFSNNGGV